MHQVKASYGLQIFRPSECVVLSLRHGLIKVKLGKGDCHI
jgi:hypothetical protein